MSNCTKIESFGATDISATLGSGINMSRAESCCTRLLLEFRSRKRFANYVLFGQVRRETWLAFFKKNASFSAGAANFKSLASTSSATSAFGSPDQLLTAFSRELECSPRDDARSSIVEGASQ